MISPFRHILPCTAVLLFLLPAAVSAAEEKDPVRFDFSPNRGLRLRAFDGDLDLRAGGRLHLDMGHVDTDATPQDDDFLVRRGRLHLKGRIVRDIRFMIDGELTGRLGGWRNLWIGYHGIDDTVIRVGNTIAPMGLAQAGSSNFTLFAERALPNALMPGFQTGGLVRWKTKAPGIDRGRWSIHGGVFTSPLGNDSWDFHDSDHVSFSARTIYAPIARRTRVLHFGGSFEYRDVAGSSDFRYRYRAESALLTTTLGTPRLQDVDDVFTWGVEGAFMYKGWSGQGEYVRADVNRRNNADPTFDGYYAELSWMLTGERRRYSSSMGTFGRVKPKSAWGAWQLGLRYSKLDLIDAGVAGGRAKNLTAGLSWYPHSNLKAMFNFIKVDSRRRNSGVRDEPLIFQFRLQAFL